MVKEGKSIFFFLKLSGGYVKSSFYYLLLLEQYTLMILAPVKLFHDMSYFKMMYFLMKN